MSAPSNVVDVVQFLFLSFVTLSGKRWQTKGTFSTEGTEEKLRLCTVTMAMFFEVIYDSVSWVECVVFPTSILQSNAISWTECSAVRSPRKFEIRC